MSTDVTRAVAWTLFAGPDANYLAGEYAPAPIELEMAESFVASLALRGYRIVPTGQTSVAVRRADPDGGDVHSVLYVFAGTDEDHRALCGSLTMLPQEADGFCALFPEARR